MVICVATKTPKTNALSAIALPALGIYKEAALFKMHMRNLSARAAAMSLFMFDTRVEHRRTAVKHQSKYENVERQKLHDQSPRDVP